MKCYLDSTFVDTVTGDVFNFEEFMYMFLDATTIELNDAIKRGVAIKTFDLRELIHRFIEEEVEAGYLEVLE